MSDFIIRIHSVPINSPKHRVRKSGDGLWHVWRDGIWIGAFGSWRRALDAAITDDMGNNLLATDAAP